ncbi:MAG TPA: hypothetical protein ENN29_06390 [Candidatus Hydrogenedentes bacterium]|nr:hypothetical protein [Candidatus Hydrogenedentota bacterium]
MDNRLLIGFGGFLAVFLLFPFVAQMLREGNAGDAENAAQTTNTAAPTTGRSNVPNEPPLLDAQNLVGTEWEFKWENYRIKITIAANGVLYATHPLMRSVTGMDYFEGRWSVAYDKAIIEARFGDEYLYEELIISGNNLYTKNGEKVQRF